MNRIHFTNPDKLILKYSDSICHECGRRKIIVEEKVWWFIKEYHGDYCINPRCRKGDENYELFRLFKERVSDYNVLGGVLDE